MSSTGLRILVIALTTAGILAAIVAGPYPLGHVQLEALGLAPEADTADRSYSRMSIPYTGVSPVWDIGPLDEVALHFEASVHYQLNSTLADAEWAALYPPNGGLVHAKTTDGKYEGVYLLSLFHQLQCLDILRQTYAARARPGGLATHCLNYIRQTILCRRDVRLEPVVDVKGLHAVQPWKSVRCKDWRQVYAAQEINAEAWGQAFTGNGTVARGAATATSSEGEA